MDLVVAGSNPVGHPRFPRAARAPVRAQRPEFGRRSSADAALACAVGSCLTQVHGNLRGVAAARDPEYLHQLRVGIRRLRSALRVWRRFGTAQPPKPLLRELRAWMAPLGVARDWDVFLASWAAELGALERMARAKRAAASRRAASVSASLGPRRVLARLEQWLRRQPAQGGRESVVPFARRVLARLHFKALREAQAGNFSDAASRHALRIRIKRLRYVAEFFASCFDARNAKRYLRRLKALQDVLGGLNDVAVARRLAGELSGDARALRRRLDSRERSLVALLEPSWTSLEAQRPFWQRREPEAIRAAA